jgi:hypothetical protein
VLNNPVNLTDPTGLWVEGKNNARDPYIETTLNQEPDANPSDKPDKHVKVLNPHTGVEITEVRIVPAYNGEYTFYGSGSNGTGDSGGGAPIDSQPRPAPGPTPTPGNAPSTGGGGRGVFRFLPRFFGGTLGAQLGMLALGNGFAGTASVFAGIYVNHPQHLHTGASYGGFFDQTKYSGGPGATAGIGPGVVISNANDDSELTGDGQAFILATPTPWGGEFDLTRNKNDEWVYTLNVTYGKSMGAVLMTFPIHSVSGPTRRIITPAGIF